MDLYPLHIAFSGYTVIGLILFILAATVAIYLLRLHSKSQATWYMIAFFTMVALSGVSTILVNSFFHWDRLFLPWQDFWILAAGIALIRFAYIYPHKERSFESKIVHILVYSLALLALAYCLVFDYRYLFDWTPGLTVDEVYYLLLPFGVLLIVIVFLRRSVILSMRAESIASQSKKSIWRHLLQPQMEDSIVFRNLALALSLAFLPALQTFLSFPDPLGFILSNIGSILAIVVITLIYFNYASEIDSFMGKLVGITLASVLLIFAVYGAIDIFIETRAYSTDRLENIVFVHDALSRTGDVFSSPSQVVYVVSWDASDPEDPGAYRQLYLSDDKRNFNLELLANENQGGALDTLSQPVNGQLAQLTNDDWRTVQRYWTYPVGSSQEDFLGYIFTEGDLSYEIGFSSIAIADHISAIVSRWLLLILVTTALILLVFPLFFRRSLVEPLENLLDGIRRVNKGELDTIIPIRFNDEIGFLSKSFNQMTKSLNQATLEIENRAFALEEQVKRRTSDLTQTNERLEQENKEREKAESRLNQQLVYQRALAGCSQSLLVSVDNENDQQKVLDKALEYLRFAAEASRAYVFHTFEDDELGTCIGMLAEMCAPGIPPQINNPINQKFPIARFQEDFLGILLKGNPYGGPVNEVFASTPDLKELFLTQSPPLLSVMFFPLYNRDQFWGFIGFDDCEFEREWQEREISILRTASEMIGNTLQRWQAEENLRETLSHLEERVRERTIEYAQANAELRHEIIERQHFQSELENRFEIERNLANISTRLLEPTNVRQNVAASLEDLGRIMGAGRIFLAEFDLQAMNHIRSYYEWHGPGVSPVSEEVAQRFIEPLSGLRDQLQMGETIYIKDTAQYQSNLDIDMQPLQARAVQSLVLSPLTIDHRVHAVLGCSNLKASPGVIQMNIQALELVASMLKSLLQRESLINTLEEQIAERTRQLTTFLDMAMLSDLEQDLSDILQHTLLSISQIAGCDAIGIHVVDQKKTSLELIAQRGIPLEFRRSLSEIKIDAELATWLAKAEPYEILDQQKSGPAFTELFQLSGYHAFIATRLSAGSKSLGLLCCYRMEDQPYSSFQATLLAALGDLLGIILENYRLRTEAQELATVEERQRLAREIHDAISQSVYSLSLFARSANDSLQAGDEAKVFSNLQDIESIALQAMRDMRLLLYQLREVVEEEDIATALDGRFKQVENRVGIQATCEIDPDIVLPPEIRHQVWRILLEALNNVVKHARAKHVYVRITCQSENLFVSIQDDGVGFDVSHPASGMGLHNIRTRTEMMRGRLDMHSELGKGTQISIKIPQGCFD